MARDQLRIYTVKPGEMGEWIAEWRRLIAPLRRQYGFQVLGAWTIEAENQFVWVLRYSGESSWEEADAAYYASGDRAAMQPDPARHIASADTRQMNSVELEV